MIERSLVEIDVEKITNNYRIYKNSLLPHQRIMAVVKANAYGHGAKEVACALSDVGVTDFAVATFGEAAELRHGGIKGEILILGYTPPNMTPKIAELDLTQSLYSEEYAKAVSDTGSKIKVHVALDTGMNRVGLDTHSVEACTARIRSIFDKFNVTGIYTHLSCADDESEENFTRVQLERFFGVADALSNTRAELHCMNSAAGLRYNDPRCSLVRLGIILYGLRPSRTFTLPQGISPALEWRSAIASVHTVSQGESIGYGRSYVAERRMRIATVSTGYGDGYPRTLSNRGYVTVRGKRSRIVGRVCMDQMTVDVTDIEDAVMGDEVTLIGDGYTADDMAHAADTIPYEIVANISPRVTKIYK